MGGQVGIITDTVNYDTCTGDYEFLCERNLTSGLPYSDRLSIYLSTCVGKKMVISMGQN